MKPRLRLIGGLWYCGTLDTQTKRLRGPMGLGYTPAGAWEAWRTA